MKQHKQSSESSRSVMAHLRSLAQPRIWGPIGVLSLLAGFIWQVAHHPDWFKVEQQQQVSTDNVLENELSDEERAIAADIDSSDFLFKELEANSPQLRGFNESVVGGENLLEAVRQAEQTQSNPTQDNSLFSEFSNTESSTPTIPQFNFSLDNSALLPPPPSGNLLTVDPLNSTQPNFNGNTNSQEQQKDNPENQAPTPLEAALEQYNNPSEASQAEAPTPTSTPEAQNREGSDSNTVNPNLADTNPSLPLNLEGNSTSTVAPSVTPTLAQPSWTVPRASSQPTAATSTPTPVINPYQTQLSIPRNLPYTAPTTPPTINPNPYGQLPSTVNPNVNYGYNSTVPNGATVQSNPQNTLLNPNPLVPQPSTYNLTPSTQPFSVPRPIPGRSIGGGRINTFANP